MQHCTVCGSELPDNARFCGKCGHVLSNIDTIDQKPTRTLDETSSTTNREDSSAENGLVQDDLTAVDTHLLTPHESNGHKPVIVSPPTAQAPAPQAKPGSAARWIAIALIIILLVGGSAAALVFLLHLPVSGLGGTPGNVTSPTSSTSTNLTPVNTVCPAGSTSCASTTPTSTGPTPTVSGTASTSTVNMTFSGAITGSMTVTNVARCGPSSSGSEYDVYVSGTIGGTPYTFVSRITSYTGPATYNTGHIFVVFSQQPFSASTIWGNSGNLPAQATINSDTKSGSMEIDLSGAANTVHVSGSWICA